ncbi:sigma-70 family RNA polymerase sigma factor [Arsenicitalea aurantiaca]|uniref:RNA polymerase sigma factor n=1 Tax=Arsenicitalea aurantiaca TaxID=1783274 RepID=A0A433XEQ1_9HYPH|nr:sigma-70 family RNA polymerase sigma factor [Arsenicitalea aurantiaca]RUT32575.1 sigma-70 family RNA polymerase sigma factor [Arsenicitalea aurantiaca]
MSDERQKPGPSGQTEADPAALLDRVARDRDKAALAELFAIFAPRIKSMMMKLGADAALAEDLAQETLLSVWRKAHLYVAGRGAVATWIFTIARNLRIDQLRRQSNKPYVDLESIEIESDARGAPSLLEESEIVDRVSRAIETLSPEQREVVRLSFVHELPHAEIAVRVGIPLGTVKSRLRLAYDRLRPMLEDLH